MVQNPRPKVLGKVDVSPQLQKLIQRAQQRLLLISPYFDVDDARVFARAIVAAANRHVDVTLVVRRPDKTTKFKKATLKQLIDLVGLGVKLRCVQDLHAKLYVSEQTAIITSLNLLDSSISNNIELGMEVEVQSPEGQALLQFYKDDIEPDLWQLKVTDEEAEAEPLPAGRNAPKKSPTSVAVSAKRAATSSPSGFCIRCHGSIPLNPDKPYCRTDYERWAEYENPNYKDKYCHRCGEEHPATLRKPLCSDCYELSTET